MKTTLDALHQAWNAGKYDPVYLFYGQDDFQIELIVEALIRKAVEPGSKDFNFDPLYGNETEGAQIVNLASAYPMMAERRVVLVKNVHLLPAADLELVARYAKSALASTCLVLTAAKIDARRTVWQQLLQNSVNVECRPLYDNQVPDWLRRRLSHAGLTITEEAIRMLQGLAGSNLRQLESEIDKVKINLGERKRIEVGDVERVVGATRQFSIFELCDAVGQRRIDASLVIVDHMLTQGEQPTGILAMLTRHFVILSRLNAMKDRRLPPESLAKALKIQPFFLKNYAAQANNFSAAQLRSAIGYLLDADLQLKSSYQKPRLVLELLLLRLQFAL
ncbi:MAG TPA: DNA polymerase III subunit delta [bacterium]|nr:DNA polymerase III subunit delta [bacterium]HQG44911.1 DNA polymerase III subunit delta [bacterium]HQI49421.1 DNA polymerase III subunit delta [bacterium]HQJ66233.1 DNA polymerase III subunit delta [bacterium]